MLIRTVSLVTKYQSCLGRCVTQRHLSAKSKEDLTPVKQHPVYENDIPSEE